MTRARGALAVLALVCSAMVVPGAAIAGVGTDVPVANADAGPAVRSADAVTFDGPVTRHGPTSAGYALQAGGISLDDGSLTVHAAAGQAITGGSDLPAGTHLSVRLRSASAENPFLMSAETTVDDEGRFRAVFDLSDVAAGTNFSVTVLRDGETLGEGSGRVTACDDDCDAGDPAATPDPAANTALDEGALTPEAGPGRSVTGTTNLPAGTPLSVRVRSASAESPFLKSAEAVVDDEGRFRAVFDFSDVSPGANISVSVHGVDETLADGEGYVSACDSACSPAEPEQTSSPPPEGGNLSLQSVVTVDRGMTAWITVGVDDGPATLRIGARDVNYAANVTVRDGNDDGTVTVRFDTADAGSPGDGDPPVMAGKEDDEVVLQSEWELPDRQAVLDAGSYDLTLYDGRTATGDPVDVGTLLIREAPVDDDDDEDSTTEPATEFGLTRNIVAARQGTPVRVPVALGDEDAATVTLGSADTGFRTNATVRDGTGDDRVVVVLATTASDDGSYTLTAKDGGDSVSVHADGVVTPDASVLPSDDYPIALYRGSEATAEPDDVGTFVVTAANDTDSSGAGTTADAPAGDGTPAGGTSPQPGGGGGLGLGMAALAVGGLLAIGGIGLLLGVFGK